MGVVHFLPKGEKKCCPLRKILPMTEWLSDVQSCIDHVTSQSCEKLKEAKKKILNICKQDGVLDQEQLGSIYTNLRALDPKTRHQLQEMLKPIRTMCEKNPIRDAVDELKTCVDAKVKDSKCAKHAIKSPQYVDRIGLVTRDDLFFDCWEENQTLKSMNVSQDTVVLIDDVFNREFDSRELEERQERCERTEWSNDTLASLAKCHEHLEKQSCESWRSAGKDHPVLICGYDDVLDEKEIQELYATIKNWGTEYRDYKLEEVDAFSFMAVMKDLACKREAEVELLKKGTSIVKDTLEQNDWKKSARTTT